MLHLLLCTGQGILQQKNSCHRHCISGEARAAQPARAGVQPAQHLALLQPPGWRLEAIAIRLEGIALRLRAILRCQCRSLRQLNSQGAFHSWAPPPRCHHTGLVAEQKSDARTLASQSKMEGHGEEKCSAIKLRLGQHGLPSILHGKKWCLTDKRKM